jgi:adenylylsulfate kinase
MEANIFPTLNKITKRDKEHIIKQHGEVIWLVGLSGSGKSTLARALEENLYEQGYITQLLDGDNLRHGINNNLGFSETDREENIRRAAEVAKLFMECGIITVCSFISPTEKIRKIAREIIGEKHFHEVYVNCSLEECERRDTKKLYQKARSGEIKNFTGISSPFEAPTEPFLEIDTVNNSLDSCTIELVEAVVKKIRFYNI